MEIMLKPWANPLNDADVNLSIADGEITRLCNIETKLRDELAAAKDEIELNEINLGLAVDYQKQLISDFHAERTELKQQLAARDLVIKQMREAVAEGMEHVEAITCDAEGSVCLLGSDDLRADKYHLQDGIDIIREALALQPSTEALDEFVQRAKEEVRDKCAAKCDEAFADNIFTTHDAAIIGMVTTKCAAAIKGMEL